MQTEEITNPSSSCWRALPAIWHTSSLDILKAISGKTSCTNSELNPSFSLVALPVTRHSHIYKALLFFSFFFSILNFFLCVFQTLICTIAFSNTTETINNLYFHPSNHMQKKPEILTAQPKQRGLISRRLKLSTFSKLILLSAENCTLKFAVASEIFIHKLSNTAAQIQNWITGSHCDNYREPRSWRHTCKASFSLHNIQPDV